MLEKKSFSDLRKVAQHYGSEYILSSQVWHPDMVGEMVAQEKNLVIWKISK